MSSSADTYTFADLSGLAASDDPNPYNALISACGDDASLIQDKYKKHRDAHLFNSIQAFTAPTFPGPIPDPVLSSLLRDPSALDPRFNLTLWARPSAPVVELISQVQARLRDVVPGIWLMPLANLHMTVLEIVPGQTETGVAGFVHALRPVAQGIADLPAAAPGAEKCRLVRPRMTFDARAMALTFLTGLEGYTYHHLRRDVYAATAEVVQVQSRYVVPSAHLTIGRFVEGSCVEVGEFVEAVKGVNDWLDGVDVDWVVGEETGLQLRCGRSWYGGGESIVEGAVVTR